MKLFIFGSCRVWDLLISKYVTILNNRTLMHDVGQYVQEIKFYNKEIIIPEHLYQYIYYSEYKQKILNNKEQLLECQNNYLKEADLVIVEISTLKYIIEDEIYLDIQQTINKPNNIILSYNKIQFENKINELIGLLNNKKILFVGHIYTPKFNIDKLTIRKILNEWINNAIKNHPNVYFFNPSEIIEKYGWEEMMKDTTHYTKKGKNTMKNYVIKFIGEIANKNL